MELVFVCPAKHEAYQTDAYSIVAHRGVRTDPQGGRHLDAKVRVDIACPFCGEHHIFRADELVCPFGQADAPSATGVKRQE